MSLNCQFWYLLKTSNQLLLYIRWRITFFQNTDCVLSHSILEHNWCYTVVNKTYCVGKQGQEKKERTNNAIIVLLLVVVVWLSQKRLFKYLGFEPYCWKKEGNNTSPFRNKDLLLNWTVFHPRLTHEIYQFDHAVRGSYLLSVRNTERYIK